MLRRSIEERFSGQKTPIGFVVDLGTSGASATAFDLLSMQVIAVSGTFSFETFITRGTNPPWVSQNQYDHQRAAVRAVKDVIKRLDDTSQYVPRALKIVGQMHGRVLLDEALKPVDPVRIWECGRAVKQAEMLAESLGRPFPSRFTLAHLLRDVADGILEVEVDEDLPGAPMHWSTPAGALTMHAGGILRSGDVVNNVGTGEYSGTGFLDVTTRDIIDLNLTDLDSDFLEELDSMGPYPLSPMSFSNSPAYVAKKGLFAFLYQVWPEVGNILLCPGDGDQIMTMLGCGAIFPGSGVIATGTSGPWNLLVEKPIFEVEIDTFSSFLEDPLLMKLIDHLGIGFEMLKRRFEHQVPDDVTFYDYAETQLQATGGHNLFLAEDSSSVVIQYFSAERGLGLTQPAAGVFDIGDGANMDMRRSPEKENLVSSLWGQIFQTCMLGRRFAAHFRRLGVMPVTMFIAGGPAQSDTFCQWYANAIGVPIVRRTLAQEATALGGAIACAVEEELVALQRTKEQSVRELLSEVTAQALSHHGKTVFRPSSDGVNWDGLDRSFGEIVRRLRKAS